MMFARTRHRRCAGFFIPPTNAVASLQRRLPVAVVASMLIEEEEDGLP